MLHVNKSSQSPPTSSQKVKEWKLSNTESPSVVQSKYINASLKCFPVNVLYLWRSLPDFSLHYLKDLCALKDIKWENKIKLPQIVEENNCVPTLAAGIVKTCKLKCWMMDSTQTIDLELLPVKISISSLQVFLQVHNYLAIALIHTLFSP